MSTRSYTVSQAARMASVTIRTLHHYDEIGLLVPSRRSASGYRLYGTADLERLHQILLFRELGFSLEAIERLLDAPASERRAALRAQREHLSEQVERARAVLRAIDATLASLDGGREMDTNTMFEGFDQFDHAPYEEEARERWGDTEAYKESMRRTKSYSKDDWARIKAEGDSLLSRWSEMLAQGRAPTDREVTEVAEQHRLHIDRWFYPCSHAMHACLAEMYVADPRFREFYETRGEGLAEFVAASIRTNSERAA